MKINHLNLSVPDVPQTARFFAEFFGLHLTEQKGRDTLAVLYDDAGFSLILSNFDRKIIPSYPRDFHLGFIQEDQEQVRAIHARLQAAGYTLKPPQDLTDRVILLADVKDGQPLPPREGPFRIIVPGEKRPARWVRQVRVVTVRKN